MPVTYRSDVNPDYRCLEDYLEGGEFGALPDAWKHQAQHDLASLNEVITALAASTPWLPDGIKEQLSLSSTIELPTKYDSPLNFQLIDGLVKRVKAAAERIGLDVTEFPYYSSIPTRQVNACAIKLPCSSKPFLLFDSQLLLYCHLFSKAFARCLPVKQDKDGEMLQLSTEIEGVRQRVERTPDVLERFSDVLRAYVTTDAPSNAKPYPLEGEYAHLATIIRDGMELFVVAHEFGHVYAGHLNDLLAGTRLNTLKFPEGSASHQQEHQADLLGLVLTLHAMSDADYDAGLSYIGIDLFFVSLDLAERCMHFVDGNADGKFESSSSESHPSNQSRRNLISEALEYIVPSTEQVEAARSLASQYDAIAKYLWAEIAASPSMHRTCAKAVQAGDFKR